MHTATSDTERWARSALSNAAARARKAGVPFALDVPTIIAAAEPFCPILGTRLRYEAKGRKGPAPDSPSLDRVIPELGYVKGNVLVCSWLANHIKNSASPEQLARVAGYVAQFAR